VDRSTSKSLSRNNPWHGRELVGAVTTTMLRGRLTAVDGAIVEALA
jgi:dihydroorotase